MNKQDKIYVAGHRGLVGSAIAKNLRSKGYTNIIERTHDALDLTDALQVRTFFEEERPQYVFLAAAKVGGIMANSTYRADFIYENLMIQNNVIHNAYAFDVKKLLFLGSTCIYPKEAPQPMSENALLTSPLEYTNEPYALAKIAGIKMCESYNLQYGTNYISVMPTNLYGPNDNFDLEKSHVLPAMIRKMHLAKALNEQNTAILRADVAKLPIKHLTSESTFEDFEKVLSSFGIYRDKLVLWGTGTPLREFLWSEDMADACVFLMENIDFKDLIPQNTSEIRNTHINIGTGKDLSIKSLAELIKNTVGYKGELHFDTTKPDGTMKKLTDPSKLHQLGWKHSVEIEEGVKMMYEEYLK